MCLSYTSLLLVQKNYASQGFTVIQKSFIKIKKHSLFWYTWYISVFFFNLFCCTLFLYNIVSHLAKETPAFFAYQINFCNRAEPVRPHIDCHWRYAFHSINAEESNRSCLISCYVSISKVIVFTVIEANVDFDQSNFEIPSIKPQIFGGRIKFWQASKVQYKCSLCKLLSGHASLDQSPYARHHNPPLDYKPVLNTNHTWRKNCLKNPP